MYGDDGHERVIYEPPKSAAFGHHARMRDAQRAWAMTTAFLDRYTVYTLGSPITFTCWAQIEWTNDDPAIAIIDAARHMFGPEVEQLPTVMRWKLRSEQLLLALQVALDNHEWPLQQRSPVSLHFWYSFVWRVLLINPIPPGTPIDDQIRNEHSSHLGISIRGQVPIFLKPTFVFPFSWDSPQFSNFLDEIEESVPFRFRDQYFKRLLPSKTGGYSRVLKLAKGWRLPNQ